MLGLFDSRGSQRINRRELLCAGALGAAGLSLPQLLRAEEAARPGKIKSCVLVFAWGGPAQQETFDMKPDVPTEVRGEFKPIATNVSGIQICEHLPRLAKHADKFAVVRSVTHKSRIHNPGAFYALTGRPPSANVVEFPAKRGDWPAIGSVLAKLQPGQAALPPYVLLPVFANDVGFPTPAQHAGFLGGAYDPLIVNGDPSKPSFEVPSLKARDELTPDRLEARRLLLGQVRGGTGWGQSAPVQGMERYYERAYDLVSSPAAKKAFDIGQEPAAVRDRYGRSKHGQSVLLARRLVEAGVRLVMVNHAEDNGQNKVWDTHDKQFPTMRKSLPQTDASLASLLEDLHDRGLLDSTLIVWMGEFGRSPRVDNGGGRDHWPDCYSVFLAGGGIKGGKIHGASDSRAAYPKDSPVGPEDIHATIYRAMGLSEETMIYDPLNRPHPLTAGKSIATLF